MFKEYGKVIIVLSILLTSSILITFKMSSTLCDGNIIYTIDDAYIHMALAKNLSQNYVWGVTRHEFTSCSSSLLWTTLISIFYLLIGTKDYIPFLLNVFSGLILVLICTFIYSKFKISKLKTFLFILLLIVCAAIVPLIFTGLEHTLHIAISILFIFLFSELLTNKTYSFKDYFFPLILAACLTTIRYEGIILILVIILFLILKRKYIYSALLFIFSFLPITIFGIYSINKGWSFFPNSILMKANLPADIQTLTDFFNVLIILFNSVFYSSNFLSLTIISVILISIFILIVFLFRKYNFNTFEFYVSILVISNYALYFIYARSGWSYRYQTLLIALTIFYLPIIFLNRISTRVINNTKIFNRAISYLIAFVIFLFVTYSSILSLKLLVQIPQSTKNIYDQHYQVARFVKLFFEDKVIAVNDVGAINYYTDIKCIDIWGLSDINVWRMKRNSVFEENEIRNYCQQKKVEIAIIYDKWFTERGGLVVPREWNRIMRLKINNNLVAGSEEISFYAVSSKISGQLNRNLWDFKAMLPKDVVTSDN